MFFVHNQNATPDHKNMNPLLRSAAFSSSILYDFKIIYLL